MTDDNPIMITSADIAAYDQAWAHSEAVLGYLVNAYLQQRAIDAAEGVPEEVSIVEMAHGLGAFAEKDVLAAALCVAIVHYARNAEAAGDD